MALTIKKKQFKTFLLDCAAHKKMGDGTPRFRRVAGGVYDMADAALKSWGVKFVDSLPSKGRTIK